MKRFFVLFLLVFVVIGCDEGMEITDDIITSEPMTEQSAIPQWRRAPHMDITLKVPEWLKIGMIGESPNEITFLHEEQPSFGFGMDRSFILNFEIGAIYQNHIYVPDRSAMYIYVFDFNGNMLEDETLSRDIILGGRASRFAPHFGNVTINGKLKHRGTIDQSIADAVRSIYVEGNTLITEVFWYEGYDRNWTHVSRLSAGSTTIHWDLDTGDYHFGLTKRPCWDGGPNDDLWCLHSSLSGIEVSDYGFLDSPNVLPIDGFNPDELVHGRTDLWRFRYGVFYEDTLYMPVFFVEGDEVLGTIPYTLYAFQSN